MKKVILIITLLVIVTLNIPLQAQWAKIYGEPNTFGHVPDCIQQCRDGGYVIVGAFWAGIYRFYDAYILKLNSSGKIEWQYAYGTYGQDGFSYVQQTSDDGYIIAGKKLDDNYRGIIVKLNWQGEVEWARDYDWISFLTFVKETADGGYIASGNGYVLKLAATGRVVWDLKYGRGNYADPFQPTADGGYIWANSHNNYFRVTKLTPNGYIEWQKSYGGSGWGSVNHVFPRHIFQTVEGDYIIVGSRYWDTRDTPICVFKLNPEGNITWQKTYSGARYDTAYSSLQTNDGGYLVACNIANKFSIIKLSPKGSVRWVRTYNIGSGNGRSNWKHPFQKTRDGGYITVCSYTDSDYFTLLKLLSDCEISPACYFIESSNVSVLKTHVVPLEEYETPETHDIKSQKINILFQNPNFSFGTLCRADSKYTLRIRSQPGGSTNPYPGKYVYYGGKKIKLTAKPEADNRFIGWSGDVPEGQEKMKSISITMDLNKKVVAEFLIPTPKRPMGLKAEALSWNRVKLTWTDKSKNEQGFKVERKQEGESQWVEIVSLKANRKSYTNQGLVEDTTYQYRVRAYNQNGYSKYSNKAIVRTKGK